MRSTLLAQNVNIEPLLLCSLCDRLAPETSVSNTSSGNMRFTSACTRDGYFFSIGVCPRVISGGTRPGIGEKRLMGVIIRGLLPKAKLHLPALGAELFVFTQEQRFLQVSRFNALSRVGTPGLETRTTSASMWKRRNCTFLHSVQSSLSLLRLHRASRVPVRLLRLSSPLRFRPAVHRLWPVRRSIIRFWCRHALLQFPTTESCWSVRLLITCQ